MNGPCLGHHVRSGVALPEAQQKKDDSNTPLGIFAKIRNEYTFSYSLTPALCSASGGSLCLPDGNEEDDDASLAWEVLSVPYVSADRTLCTGDDDWHKVWLWFGETVSIHLSFQQNQSDQDLDLHLYDWVGTDTTPCSVQNPSSCSISNGQSSYSDEFFEGVSLASGYYYVVARGFNGSANEYDIQIDIR